ncbi:TPA: hypothetical protein DIU27_01520 [Candidatus Collierbacteria bacterium]|uniref:Uncharacterized protein n=1 Tax=Candidatus Collierbacteria bacterium GW2011_GWB2_44_22 TaxID=1618387 RepID=A0A0G1HYJ1_9BACT|nr:MAG: hypothetical protein UW31_C0005G0139 [Candidatus Collierbacteria bacterium GW2011_GWA2_44_13]KKT51628.1 MAG: hypothetical protein UW44_C0010G0066 [Candidatus Collierbacteria bacterium GW2011_GWB2_44_22]KKT63079.1 MAG: hypothetical protein UW56_C0002G0064 [Candidatus Collierbacteria bacterium GW2011_GWD1_44_27]KKT64001.1 MAG: hypothetical protein UW58_C0051G0003 [Candidatus Collierbacteria bacterium GW2011_GWC2_44_30]KKT68967.1 MAG: hypothetical protein UW64_C0006G0023 [Microgenomates gr
MKRFALEGWIQVQFGGSMEKYVHPTIGGCLLIDPSREAIAVCNKSNPTLVEARQCLDDVVKLGGGNDLSPARLLQAEINAVSNRIAPRMVYNHVFKLFGSVQMAHRVYMGFYHDTDGLDKPFWLIARTSSEALEIDRAAALLSSQAPTAIEASTSQTILYYYTGHYSVIKIVIVGHGRGGQGVSWEMNKSPAHGVDADPCLEQIDCCLCGNRSFFLYWPGDYADFMRQAETVFLRHADECEGKIRVRL